MEPSTEHGDALPHPDEAGAGPARRRRGTVAVVTDDDLQPPVVDADDDAGPLGAGVSDHVRQRLLHDAVDRCVDRAVQGTGEVDVELDMRMESDEGRVRVVEGGGEVAGIPTGPLAEIITSAIAIEL